MFVYAFLLILGFNPGSASHGTSSHCTCPFWVLPFFTLFIYLEYPVKLNKKKNVLEIDTQLSEEITATREERKPTQNAHKYVSGNNLAADVSKVLVCFNCQHDVLITEKPLRGVFNKVLLYLLNCNTFTPTVVVTDGPRVNFDGKIQLNDSFFLESVFECSQSQTSRSLT